MVTDPVLSDRRGHRNFFTITISGLVPAEDVTRKQAEPAVARPLKRSFIGDYPAGAWCFILGSLLFVTGATIDVLQIVLAPNIRVRQLLNLTALAFVVGSALFVVASVPYLFKFKSSTDEQTVDTFLAAQFVVGSFLFLVGGVFNYRREFLVIDSATDR